MQYTLTMIAIHVLNALQPACNAAFSQSDDEVWREVQAAIDRIRTLLKETIN